jgi:RsiW-degrading membrane proteinase PrsW (M82 family)
MGVTMRDRRILLGLTIVAAGIAATSWSLLEPAAAAAPVILIAGAAAAPVGVLAIVVARAGAPTAPLRAAVGGALVGPIVAIASHAFVAAFAYLFFLGFADAGRALADALRIDPRLSELLSSPWAILLLVDLAVVAPLTEEAGKAMGGFLFARPQTRRDAFLVGAAAGTGFAVVENVLYAGLAAAFGGPWQSIVIARMVAAPVHVLASGLVGLGVWDRREGRPGALPRAYGAGVGVHALWNGSLVALVIAGTVGSRGGPAEIVELAFSAALGVVLCAALWSLAGRVAREGSEPIHVRSRAAVAAWVVLVASLLVPATVLVVIFPLFYVG